LFGLYDERTLVARRHFALDNMIVNGAKAGIEGFSRLKADMIERFGRRHPQTVYATYFLGASYRFDGQIDKALAEFDACSKVVFDKDFRIDHPDVEAAIMVHVGTLRAAGRNADAVKKMEMALAMREEQKCAESQMDWEFRHQLGWSYMGEKKYDHALRVFQKNAENARPPQNDQKSHESLASVLQKLERHEEARQNLQKALDLRYARNGTGYKSWETGRLKSKIGETLMALKRYADAEPLMLAGFKEYQDHLAQMPPYNRTHMKGAAWELHKLYKQLDKPDEAAKWKAVAEKLKDDAKEKAPATAAADK
jgi:eukaryotic-like serine/threonine-protein kinase